MRSCMHACIGTRICMVNRPRANLPEATNLCMAMAKPVPPATLSKDTLLMTWPSCAPSRCRPAVQVPAWLLSRECLAERVAPCSTRFAKKKKRPGLQLFHAALPCRWPLQWHVPWPSLHGHILCAHGRMLTHTCGGVPAPARRRGRGVPPPPPHTHTRTRAPALVACSPTSTPRALCASPS